VTGVQAMANSQNASGSVVKEHLYKVLVIGEFGVGKTSLIRRYTEGFFSPNYKLTIGVDFALKTLQWSEDTKINLQLWDIAGHERFGHMTRVYYKYAIAAIIVYDLSRPATFDSVLKWHRDVNQKVMLANEQPVPILLLANKCDLEDAHFDPNLLDEFCKEHGFIGW
jgi:Ras-related protein Rab-32